MVNRGPSRRDLLVQVSKLYYLEGLSQQKIADKIKTTRSNVSKMIRRARKLNIVQIRIDDTSTPGFLQQIELMEAFNLSEVIVIPSLRDPENTKMELGNVAADLLQSLITDNIRIGITWGTTIYQVVNQFRPQKVENALVYQLMGGTGAKNPETDGREQTLTLARKLNATSFILQAPLIVQSKKLRNMLLKEPEISSTLKEAAKVDIAITGLGINDVLDSNLLKVGYFTESDLLDLRKKGAIGDLCGWHLDSDGNLCNLEIHNRIIGISLDRIKKIKTVIAVAMGKRKAPTILACLKGGHLDYLVIDEEAASEVISINNNL